VQSERTEGWPVEYGPLVVMRLWLTRPPLRIGPIWALLAGALASGALTWQFQELIRLLVLACLVDLIWGGLWLTLTTPEQGDWAEEGERPRFRPSLPYARPGSPVALLWGEAGNDHPLTLLWRSGMPALLVMLVISAWLGSKAMLASLLAVVLCLIGWATAWLRGRPDAWAQAALTVGLPWGLGFWSHAPMTLTSLGALLVWTLWQRAALGITRGERLMWGLLVLAQGAAVALLVWVQKPLWAAIMAILLVPTWWRHLWSQWADRNLRGLAHVQIWWWLALLAMGWALGGGLG